MDIIRKIIRQVLSESYGPEVSYSAVVIEDAAEIQKIQELAEKYVPVQGWRIPYNYHMTITQGPIPKSLELRGDLNKEVDLTIDMIGISEKAIAFGTFGYYSVNDMPHITIAFSKKNGALPSDSKTIDNWKPIDKVIVKGVIREVGLGNKIFKEVQGMRTSTTTGGLNAFPGIPDEFPNPENYDQFGNQVKDTK